MIFLLFCENGRKVIKVLIFGIIIIKVVQNEIYFFVDFDYRMFRMYRIKHEHND